MSLSQSYSGDNPQQPGISAQVYVPDQLIADAKNLVSQPVLLAPGTYKRGTVLGMQSANPLTAVAAATNTGNGTISALSTKSFNTGVYTLIATGATVFEVLNPEGINLGNATVGTPFVSSEISFTLAAGATAFVAGDQFAITAYDATGYYVACVKTATDGSGDPVAILADDVSSSTPVGAGAYVSGEFNVNALTYDVSWSPLLLTAALRKFSLFAKASMSAAPPSNNSAP